jgi:KDO2-lipid IV(A) lauroyltransferase
LALKTQAPLITAFVSYTENGIHIDFKNVVLPSAGEESAKVREIVQMTAQHFEGWNIANPSRLAHVATNLG